MRQHHCTLTFQASKSPEIWRCFCITGSYKLIESYWGRGTVQYSVPIFAKQLFQMHGAVSRLFFLQYVSPHNDKPALRLKRWRGASGPWCLVRYQNREWQNSTLWKRKITNESEVSRLFLLDSMRQNGDPQFSQHISVMCRHLHINATFLIKFSQKPMIWAASHIKPVYNSKLFLRVKYCCISDSNFWIRICIQSYFKMQNMHNGDCKYSNKCIKQL